MPERAHPIDIVYGPRAELRTYDVVVAYNGNYHYAPTVAVSSVEVPNWAISLVLQGLDSAVKYATVAANEADDMRQDMHIFIREMEKLTTRHIHPWQNREEGQGPRVVGVPQDQPDKPEQSDQSAQTEESAPPSKKKKKTKSVPDAKQYHADDAKGKDKLWYECQYKDPETNKVCEEVFQKSNDYEDHYKGSHQGLLRCPHCQDGPFPKKWNLTRHIRRWHPEKLTGETEEEQATSFECSRKKCKAQVKKFKSKDAFEHHNFAYHKVGKGIHCNACGHVFFPKAYYLKHLKGCNKKSRGTKKTIQCANAHCTKLFSYRQAMRRHYSAEHSSSPDFKCAVCEKVVTTKKALEFHMTTHMGDFVRVKDEQEWETPDDDQTLDYFDPEEDEEGGKNVPIEID